MNDLNYHKCCYKIVVVALALEAILLAFGLKWILILMAATYLLLVFFSKEIIRIQGELYKTELDEKFEQFRQESLKKIGKW